MIYNEYFFKKPKNEKYERSLENARQKIPDFE